MVEKSFRALNTAEQSVTVLRSPALSRSAFDSWYSAPQISRAFRVGSPSCTSMREDEKEGSAVAPKSYDLAGSEGKTGGAAGTGTGREVGRFHSAGQTRLCSGNALNIRTDLQTG